MILLELQNQPLRLGWLSLDVFFIKFRHFIHNLEFVLSCLSLYSIPSIVFFPSLTLSLLFICHSIGYFSCCLLAD